MGSVHEPPVILYDYQFAPNAQKARTLLTMCGIPFQVVEQPFVMPRPILSDLDITYRRIPVNAIGRDFYLDNRIFMQAVQSAFPEKAATLAKSHAVRVSSTVSKAVETGSTASAGMPGSCSQAST